MKKKYIQRFFSLSSGKIRGDKNSQLSLKHSLVSRFCYLKFIFRNENRYFIYRFFFY